MEPEERKKKGDVDPINLVKMTNQQGVADKQSISINFHLINTKKWAALGADAIDPLLFLDQHIPLLIQQMLTE